MYAYKYLHTKLNIKIIILIKISKNICNTHEFLLPFLSNKIIIMNIWHNNLASVIELLKTTTMNKVQTRKTSLKIN